MGSKTTRQQGQAIELWVADYLLQCKLEILQRNFRCRFGEIDLICLHQKDLVFIEVRFRSLNCYGGALASIDYHKQQKIRRSAEFFLLTRPNLAKLACRFDVIAVTLKGNEPLLEWIQNAFY